MNNESKQKKSKVNVAMILFIVFGMACGWFGADFLSGIQKKLDLPQYLIIIYLMVMFFISFIITPIIHETGHLVMGLLTGYDFVSFRVGSFTLIMENGKLKRRKFNILGTGGQCILTHKESEHPENLPFFWYHFGGVFFNFITSVVCAAFILLTKNSFVMVGFAMLGTISLFIGLMNIIPSNNMGVPNDGYNIRLLKKSAADRVAMYKILIINGLQYSGVKLEDMPQHLISFSENELNCISGTSLKVLEANKLMNNHNFSEAEDSYRKLVTEYDIPALIRNECRCELMFCMIMNGKPKEEIDGIFDKELRQYIDFTGKTYVMRKRLMYAYYHLLEKNDEKAAKEYELAEKMENTYPSKGEYYSEIELLKFVSDCER